MTSEKHSQNDRIEKKRFRCHYCGMPATKTKKIANHHVFGQINSDVQVPACDKCHDSPTTVVNALPKWMSVNTAPMIINRLKALRLFHEHHALVLTREVEITHEAIRLTQEALDWFNMFKKEIMEIEKKHSG